MKLEVTDRDKLNTRKQSRALMPNLIHSLDGTALALLINFYFKYDNINLFTIHDCFAVPTNNVTKLISYLKLTYWHIYTKEPFLKSFHFNFIENLKKIYKIEIIKETKKIRKTKKNKENLTSNSNYIEVSYFKLNIAGKLTRFNIPGGSRCK